MLNMRDSTYKLIRSGLADPSMESAAVNSPLPTASDQETWTIGGTGASSHLEQTPCVQVVPPICAAVRSGTQVATCPLVGSCTPPAIVR